MKARVTFTDSDGDSGPVDGMGDWRKDGTLEADNLSQLLADVGYAAKWHRQQYDTTITKIEIEIIG
jgi:hypothetical protein